VSPLGDAGTDLWARFEDEGFQATVEEVGGGGQPYWTGSDDHHGEPGPGGWGCVGVIDPHG
jgi:hypothetical protein